MVTVYGTLGFTADKFLPSLASRPDVEAAVVFHDQHDRSVEACGEVARYCASIGVDFRSHQVNAFDIVGCAREIQNRLREVVTGRGGGIRGGPSSVVFNISGGTKALSSGAVLACILEGVPAAYVDERDGREAPLPLVEMPYRELLGSKRRRVLRFIADHPRCSQQEVQEGIGISKPTVSHHVRELVGAGLVKEARHPEDARRKVLEIIPSAVLLLPPEDEEEHEIEPSPVVNGDDARPPLERA